MLANRLVYMVLPICCLVVTPAKADALDPVELFIQFERVFYEGSRDEVELLLTSDYEFQQTTQVLQLAEETRTLNRDRVLHTLVGSSSHAETTRAPRDSIHVTRKTEDSLCLMAELDSPGRLMGRQYRQHILREVCFRVAEEGTGAYSHRVHIHYQSG
ncbi:MAG: hypothetical protein JJU10_10020 [Idiomarina sp.]|nr:hypothetical protein [Idiomarina sp.]